MSGLLKAQSGILPTFRILTEDGQHKVSLFSTPLTSQGPITQLPGSPSVNIPPPSILSTPDEPLIAYKLEDYNKRFGDQRSEQETTVKQPITIEGLLRSQRFATASGEGGSVPATSTPISSLLSLARHMPSVHITSASTVSTQIQQLLSSLAKSTNISANISSAVPSTVLTPLKLPSSQSGVNQSVGLSPANNQLSLSNGQSLIQSSQSGSPLQNSVPTLMSSLAKTTSLTGGNVIKIITSASATESDVKLVDKIPAVQKLQFPEFTIPGTVAMVTNSTSQNVDSPQSKIQVIESELVTRPSPVETQAQIHITVNRNGAYTTHTPTSSLVTGVTLAPLAVPKAATTTNLDTTVPIVSDSAQPSGSSVSASTTVLKPVSSEPTSSVACLTQGGHTYSVPHVETLGKVSSMLESSPVTEYVSQSLTSSVGPHTISTAAISSPRIQTPTTSVSTSLSGVPKVTTVRAPPNVTVSYTATPKQSLSTLASTRTRRIRTPKQFDL